MRNFIGIDPGLTATGYAIITGKGALIEYGTLVTKERRVKGWDYYASQLLEFFKTYEDLYGVIESVAYRSFTAGYSAELGAVIRYCLYRNGHSFKDVNPTELKKAVTGKGNSDKKQMAVATSLIWNVAFEDDHQTDAFGLAKCEQEGKFKVRTLDIGIKKRKKRRRKS